MKGRRANGEGSVYEFIQKVKRNNKNLEICETCRNCTNRALCNNREDCKKLCDKCKNCTTCLKYCDRYYIYERHVSQATKKDGTRTSPVYAKKKKDAAKNNLDTISKISDNTFVDKSLTTLYEIAKYIVEDRHNKNKTNDNSYIANLAKLNRLQQHSFMHKPAQKVTDEEIHNYLNYMTNYSDSVIGKDFGLLNATLVRAVRKKIIPLNPLDDKDEFSKPISKLKTEKVRAFTLSEQRKFLQSIKTVNKSNKYRQAWLLMLNVGARPGEIYALSLDDIDFEMKKIHIRNSLTKDKGGNTILGDRTKTYFGDRFIDMDRDTEVILNEILEISPTNKYNLLFWDTDRDTFMSISASNSAFKRFCNKNDVGKGIDETQYVLRHSFATRKIEAGMPPEVLKNVLGHKDISVTLNTYFDAFAEYKNKYNKKAEDYNRQQKITYTDLSRTELVSAELSKLETLINTPYLDDLDKKILFEALDKIKNKYCLLKEKTC